MTLPTKAPENAGFRPGAMDAVDDLIRRALASRAFPGGVVAVGKDGALVHLDAFGRFSYEPSSAEVRRGTIYDLASLTKVVVTTTIAMILVDEGRLDVDAPVASLVREFSGGAKDRVTLRHLLSHSSGMSAWAPLYLEAADREAYRAGVVTMELAYEPGTRSVYSDLGFFLLGEILVGVAGEALDTFASRRILTPLGMTDTGFRPPAALQPRIPPTELDAWRGRVVQGEVHDENAFFLGGVAAHSGLFGTALDLAVFAQMLLAGGSHEGGRIVSSRTIGEFTRLAGIPDSTRALGWDTPGGNSAGRRLSPRSFGHTGFTGTSLWIDPERGLFLMLLTNRVHPSRENVQIREIRPVLADLVVEGIATSGSSDGSRPASPS